MAPMPVMVGAIVVIGPTIRYVRGSQAPASPDSKDAMVRQSELHL